MPKIYNDEYFQKGFFNIQDESAGLMSVLLNPKEDDLVLDVCAAPGGKSSHISELMIGRGRILSIDKYLTKVDIMKKNFERLDMKNVLAFHEDIIQPKTEMLREKITGKVDCVDGGVDMFSRIVYLLLDVIRCFAERFSWCVGCHVFSLLAVFL